MAAPERSGRVDVVRLVDEREVTRCEAGRSACLLAVSGPLELQEHLVAARVEAADLPRRAYDLTRAVGGVHHPQRPDLADQQLVAGIVRYHGIAETTARDWQRMLDVNVSAAWWLCQAVWPGMVARRYGRIVLTTSGFALRVVPGADVTGYSVGKAAQFGLMNALASEGEPYGILVNALAPVAATRIFRREVGSDEMSPDAVAPAAAVLASRDCVWNGQVLVAQDGEFALDSMARTPVRNLGRSAQPEDLLRLADDNAGMTTTG